MVEAMNNSNQEEKEEDDVAEETGCESPSKAERLQTRLESLQVSLTVAQDRIQELELQI